MRPARSEAPAARREPPDAKVTALADTYLAAYFDRYPGTGHLLRHSRPAPRSAAGQLAGGAEGVGGARGRLAGRGQGDRSRGDRAAAAEGHLRDRPRGARRRDRRARLPQRAVERQPDDRLAGESGLPGHDSAGRHRRGAQEALARWAALPAYIDTEIANVREGLRLKYTAPTRQRPDRHRPDRQPVEGRAPPTRRSCRPAQRDKTPEFAQGVHDALPRTDRAGADALPRLPREGVPAGGARRDRGDGQPGRRRLLCRRGALFQHPADRAAQTCTRPACGRSTRLDAEMRAIAERTFQTSDVQALLEKVRSDRQYCSRAGRS